jgi:hypothetical protein
MSPSGHKEELTRDEVVRHLADGLAATRAPNLTVAQPVDARTAQSIEAIVAGSAPVVADFVKEFRDKFEHMQRVAALERVRARGQEHVNQKLRARIEGLSARIRCLELEMRDQKKRR